MKTADLKRNLKSRVAIVVPAYNEEKAIGNVLSSLKRAGYKQILVVDDGSTDSTSVIAEKHGAILLRHLINRGLGGALATGIKGALKLTDASVIVTFDADGQHAVEDIERLVKPIFNGDADVVIGSRLINPKGMPLLRRIGNWELNVLTFLLFGRMVTDSQSGLRAFSRKAAAQLEITSNRMEVSSEIIGRITEKKLRLKEVPIRAIYTDYSLSKGQSIFNGFRIIFKLLIKWITS
ncbi:MAG: glycosyltransferase family 2 protein [Candidatus Woesearchaeota archaeon]